MNTIYSPSKHLLAFAVLMSLGLSAYSQEPFSFRYVITDNLMNKLRLYEKTDSLTPDTHKPAFDIATTGRVIPSKKDQCCNDTLLIASTDTTELETYKRRYLASKTTAKGDTSKITYAKLLVGSITINDSHDTLTIKPWYERENQPGVLTDASTPRQSVPIDDEHEYILVIDWGTATEKKLKSAKSKSKNVTINGAVAPVANSYYVFDIPFRYMQWAATSLPVRFDIKTGDFKGEFLNVNVAYMFMYGRTRFYKSKFIDPRQYQWGVGPYVGGSAVTDKAADGSEGKERFAINYGVNWIYATAHGLNLSFALGAESNFETRQNQFNPYVAAGFGVGLDGLFMPENKGD